MLKINSGRFSFLIVQEKNHFLRWAYLEGQDANSLSTDIPRYSSSYYSSHFLMFSYHKQTKKRTVMYK